MQLLYSGRLKERRMGRILDSAPIQVLSAGMPTEFRVAAVARRIEPTHSLRVYARRMSDWVEHAALLGCSLIAFPEHNAVDLLHVLPGSALHPKNALHAAAPALYRSAMTLFSRLAQKYGIAVFTGTLPEPRKGGQLYATGVLFDRKGQLVLSQRKLVPHAWEREIGFVPGESVSTAQLGRYTVCCLAGEDAACIEAFQLAKRRGAQFALVARANAQGNENAHELAGAWMRAQENSIPCVCPGLFGSALGQTFRNSAAIYAPMSACPDGVAAGPTLSQTPTLVHADLYPFFAKPTEDMAPYRVDSNPAFERALPALYIQCTAGKEGVRHE